MSYRPYPDADRALSHVRRGKQPNAEAGPWLSGRFVSGFDGPGISGSVTITASDSSLTYELNAAGGFSGPLPAGRQTGGTIAIGESSTVQVVEVVPWTPQEYERWRRTGFPPGSGWEPPQTDA